MTEATRPCQPGDRLARCVASCGAYYEIHVAEPPEHPASGTAESLDIVALRGQLHIPLDGSTSFLVAPRLRPALRRLDWPLGAPENHQRTIRVQGAAIAPLLHELRERLGEALAILQAEADRHEASRAQLDSSREEAYRAFPVAK